MKLTPFACFGLMLMRNVYEEGETVNVEIYDTSNNVLYISQGFEMKDGVQTYVTGELAHVQQRHGPGSTVVSMHDNYTVWCYSPEANRGYLPDIEKFELAAGAETTLAANTKLFLCRGSMQTQDRTITGPTQVRIKTPDAQFKATADCYGLIFT
jgi:hypothetical protein